MSRLIFERENTWTITVYNNGSYFQTHIFGAKGGNPLSIASIRTLAKKKVLTFKGELHLPGSHTYTVENFDKSVVFKGSV